MSSNDFIVQLSLSKWSWPMTKKLFWLPLVPNQASSILLWSLKDGIISGGIQFLTLDQLILIHL